MKVTVDNIAHRFVATTTIVAARIYERASILQRDPRN